MNPRVRFINTPRLNALLVSSCLKIKKTVTYERRIKKTITCGRLILTSKYLLKGLKSKIASVSKIIIGANKVSSDTSKPIAVGVDWNKARSKECNY